MIFKSLSDINASAKTTEATTTQVTSRALDAILGRVTKAEQETTLRVAQTLEHLLPKEYLREVKKELTDAFSTLKSTVAPASSGYDWGPFIRRISDLQGKNRFLSVKWLHQKHFTDDPGMQEALQIAIAQKMLLTYHLENPKKDSGAKPTLCCKLDLSNPTVAAALSG